MTPNESVLVDASPSYGVRFLRPFESFVGSIPCALKNFAQSESGLSNIFLAASLAALNVASRFPESFTALPLDFRFLFSFVLFCAAKLPTAPTPTNAQSAASPAQALADAPAPKKLKTIEVGYPPKNAPTPAISAPKALKKALPAAQAPPIAAAARPAVRSTVAATNTAIATHLNILPIHPNNLPKNDVPAGSTQLIGSFPQYPYRFSVCGLIKLAASISIGSTCVNRPCWGL